MYHDAPRLLIPLLYETKKYGGTAAIRQHGVRVAAPRGQRSSGRDWSDRSGHRKRGTHSLEGADPGTAQDAGKK